MGRENRQSKCKTELQRQSNRESAAEQKRQNKRKAKEKRHSKRKVEAEQKRQSKREVKQRGSEQQVEQRLRKQQVEEKRRKKQIQQRRSKQSGVEERPNKQVDQRRSQEQIILTLHDRTFPNGPHNTSRRFVTRAQAVITLFATITLFSCPKPIPPSSSLHHCILHHTFLTSCQLQSTFNHPHHYLNLKRRHNNTFSHHPAPAQCTPIYVTFCHLM